MLKPLNRGKLLNRTAKIQESTGLQGKSGGKHEESVFFLGDPTVSCERPKPNQATVHEIGLGNLREPQDSKSKSMRISEICFFFFLPIH